ncbi:MAG: asparagine synthase-related protein [Methanoculleus sp.]
MAGVRGLDVVLRSYEPIAVALSGGTDSSVLLTYARRHTIQAIAISVDTGLTPQESSRRPGTSRTAWASCTSQYRLICLIFLQSGRTGRIGATSASGP